MCNWRIKMYKQPKWETKADINDIITHLREARGLMVYVGISSDLIYQARIEQFIESTTTTIDNLTKIKESLDGDKNE